MCRGKRISPPPRTAVPTWSVERHRPEPKPDRLAPLPSLAPPVETIHTHP